MKPTLVGTANTAVQAEPRFRIAYACGDERCLTDCMDSRMRRLR